MWVEAGRAYLQGALRLAGGGQEKVPTLTLAPSYKSRASCRG